MARFYNLRVILVKLTRYKLIKGKINVHRLHKYDERFKYFVNGNITM